MATEEYPRRVLTVTEFCRSFHLSRGSTYKLLNSGKLASILIGRRRLILRDSAESLCKPGQSIEL